MIRVFLTYANLHNPHPDYVLSKLSHHVRRHLCTLDQQQSKSLLCVWYIAGIVQSPHVTLLGKIWFPADALSFYFIPYE